MLTVAQIAVAATLGTLSFVHPQALSDAQMTLACAIDPCWIGEEPHLRMEIDRCGLEDDALVSLEQQVWAELARRKDAEPALPSFDNDDFALPLAA